MKKIFILLLTLLCLVGCGRKKEEEDTGYINNTRSSSLIYLIRNYTSVARNGVNAGEYNVYDGTTLYLIPAGDNKNYSCLMSDTTSFVKWKYLYIGVLYNESSFNYYAIGEDEDGYGIAFVNISELSVDNIYTSSRLDKEGYDIIQKVYNDSGNNVTYELNVSDDYSKLSKILPVKEGSYKKIVIIGSKNCKV